MSSGDQIKILSVHVFVNGVEGTEALEGDTLSFAVTVQSLISTPQYFLVEVLEGLQPVTELYGLYDTWQLQGGEIATVHFSQTTTMPNYNVVYSFYASFRLPDPGGGWATDYIWPVTVNLATVTLTMVSSEGGSTTPAAGSHSYLKGADVTVEAFPDADYEFHHWGFVSLVPPWSGTDGRNPVSLFDGYLDRDLTVTPVFQYVPPPPPPPCSSDADCPAGQVCVGGVCVDAPPPPKECPFKNLARFPRLYKFLCDMWAKKGS